MVKLADAIMTFILSLIKSLLCRNHVARLAKVIELSCPENTEYTHATWIGHIALIDEELTKNLWRS